MSWVNQKFVVLRSLITTTHPEQNTCSAHLVPPAIGVTYVTAADTTSIRRAVDIKKELQNVRQHWIKLHSTAAAVNVFRYRCRWKLCPRIRFYFVTAKEDTAWACAEYLRRESNPTTHTKSHKTLHLSWHDCVTIKLKRMRSLHGSVHLRIHIYRSLRNRGIPDEKRIFLKDVSFEPIFRHALRKALPAQEVPIPDKTLRIDRTSPKIRTSQQLVIEPEQPIWCWNTKDDDGTLELARNNRDERRTAHTS